MAYPQDRWSTGELITAEKMNFLNQAISAGTVIQLEPGWLWNSPSDPAILVGQSTIQSLEAGQIIHCILPWSHDNTMYKSNILLRLTLSNGVVTDDIPMYLNITNDGTHATLDDLALGGFISLIYRENVTTVSDSTIEKGWFLLDSTQINNINKELTVRLPIAVNAINEDILPNFFGFQNSNSVVPIELKRGAIVDIKRPIIYIEKQYTNDNDKRWISKCIYSHIFYKDINHTIAYNFNGFQNLYIKGQLGFGMFMITDTDDWLTDTLKDDNYYYLKLGYGLFGTFGDFFQLLPTHELYYGSQFFQDISIQALSAAQQADTRSTTNQTNISTINDEIDALQATDTNFESRISTLESAAFGSTLEIGGRNLLRHTKDLNYGLPFIGGHSSITFETDDEQYVSAIVPARNDWTAFNIHIPDVDISRMNGRQMTLSAWLKASELATNPNKFTMGIGSFNANNTRRKYKSVNLANTSVHGTKIDNEWCRLSLTINVPDDFTSGSGEDTDHYGVFFYTSNTNSTSPLYVRQPQLEFGNVVTDWKPAPEDYYDQALQLTNAKNLIINTSLALDATDKTTWPRLIEQVSDSYIANSNTIASASHGFLLTQSASAANNLVYRMGKDGDASLCGLELNKTYTIMFDYECKLYTGITSGRHLEFYTYSNKTGTWAIDSVKIIEDYSENTGELRSGHITHTFKLDSNITEFAIYISTRGTNVYPASGDYFKIENLMLVEGAIEVDYKPSVSDASLLINKVNGQITTLATATEINTQNITEMNSNITQLADSISTTVAKEVTTTTGGMQSSISELKQTADNLSLSLTQIQNQESTSAWANYQLEGNVGTLTLGQTDSEYKAQVTNTGFRVVQQGTTIASMTQGKVRATNFAVENQLEIGNYMFREDDNGGFYIL